MTQTFTLTSPALQATISTHGARLETLRFHAGPSLVLHAPDKVWHDSYAGAIVGPVANRVAGGQFALKGQTHQMARNENATTALHSGPDGLDTQIWEVIAHSAQALHLRCVLADGVGGLPGTRRFEVIYSVDGSCLALDIRATTDAPTPISIAHHPYWRLGDAADHRLQVAARSYLPVDARNLPTGNIVPVAGTVFDHRTPRPVDTQTDHNFCLSDAARTMPQPVATLHGSDGLSLQIDSTEPGLQVYAGAYLPNLPDAGISPWAGIALEPQRWPNAVNMPEFPPIITDPRTPYHQITRYNLRRSAPAG